MDLTELRDAVKDGLNDSPELIEGEIYGFVGQRGPVIVQSQLHTWIGPDGLPEYMALMRGEKDLPHSPSGCITCYEMYLSQCEAIAAGRGWEKDFLLNAPFANTRDGVVKKALREMAHGS